jgi:hypothetical protein
MIQRMGGLLLCVLLPSVTLAAADVASPFGFEKAKFAAPLAEVKKLYPDMRELSSSENLGAVPVGGPYIARYVLQQHKIEGLEKPVDVELRFWKERFWLFIVYLGENDPQAAVEGLTAQYGPVSNTDGRFPLWNLPKATIVVELKEKRYTINDEEISEDARAWFIELVRARRGSVPPVKVDDVPASASAAPGANPPGGTEGKP